MRRSSEATAVRAGHGVEERKERKPVLVRPTGLSTMLNDMERMMEETLGGPLHRLGLTPLGGLFRGLSGDIPVPVDLFLDGTTLVVRTELPGLKREEIGISITGNLLVISGEKKSEEKIEEKGYLRRETSSGYFRRSVTLPEGIDTEHVTATLKDGILEIRMETSGDRGVRHITVQ